MLPFDPKMLTAKANEILSMDVEGLGEVKFGCLDYADRIRIKGLNLDAEETGMVSLYEMLKKAYPDITLEEIKKWPYHICVKIGDAIEKKLDFRAKE